MAEQKPEQHDSDQDAERAKRFTEQAGQAGPGWLQEFGDFLLHNKKWWLTPIILMLILMGILIALAGTPAAPFIYTLW